MGNVVELQHAVLDHYMTIARERCSTTQEFRAAFGHLGQILAVEMTKNIAGEAKVIETPLSTQIYGEFDALMLFVAKAIKESFEAIDNVVLNMKIVKSDRSDYEPNF